LGAKERAFAATVIVGKNAGIKARIFAATVIIAKKRG